MFFVVHCHSTYFNFLEPAAGKSLNPYLFAVFVNVSNFWHLDQITPIYLYHSNLFVGFIGRLNPRAWLQIMLWNSSFILKNYFRQKIVKEFVIEFQSCVINLTDLFHRKKCPHTVKKKYKRFSKCKIIYCMFKKRPNLKSLTKSQPHSLTKLTDHSSLRDINGPTDRQQWPIRRREITMEHMKMYVNIFFSIYFFCPCGGIFFLIRNWDLAKNLSLLAPLCSFKHITYF